MPAGDTLPTGMTTGRRVPLDLEQKTGKIERDVSDPSMESYNVYPSHPAYPFIWHTCLSINAMSSAICALDNQPLTAGYLSLACKAHDATARLPAVGMVERVRMQAPGEGPWVQVTFAAAERDKNSTWATGFRDWMWLTVGAGFVQLYEEHKQQIHRRVTAVAPATKIVRDACAHGMKITCRKGTRVLLGQREVSAGENGRRLDEFIGLGDFFVLALRAFSEPTQPAPRRQPAATRLR